jgi:predicted HTH transcriptional regulator
MIEGKKVLEVTILKGEERPYFAHNEENKWRVYIRVKDQNILANKVLINAWKRKARPEGTYVNYSDKEKLLLEYLEDHDSISISRFRKLAKISVYKAENILTNFLALDIIEIEISEKQTLYKLSKSFESI